MLRGSGSRFVGRLPALAGVDVAGVPIRPVVLRSRRFVLAMTRLSASRRRLCQRGEVEAPVPVLEAAS